MRLELFFETEYRYDPPAATGLTALRLLPGDRPGQRVTEAAIEAIPGRAALSYIDSWGTRVDLVEIRSVHASARFRAVATVETAPVEVDLSPTAAESALFTAPSSRVPLDGIDGLESWLMPGAMASWADLETVLAWIPQRFAYAVGLTDAGTSLLDFVRLGAGVCQDFAHLFLAIVRRWGWCARYVSGYYFSAERDQLRIDAEASHAWIEVYRPGAGWVGLDATTGRLTDDRYVVIGTGRDYDDVTPVRGIIAGNAIQSHASHLQISQSQQ